MKNKLSVGSLTLSPSFDSVSTDFCSSIIWSWRSWPDPGSDLSEDSSERNLASSFGLWQGRLT